MVRTSCGSTLFAISEIWEHGADVEDAGDRAEQLHRAFDGCGTLALDCGAPRHFREPLVRQPDSDVIRQSLDQGEVLGRIRLGTPREQHEDAHDFAVDEDRRTQARPQPSLGTWRSVQEPRHHRILKHAVSAAAHELGGTVARAGVQTVLQSVFGREREVRFIVRHDPRGDRAKVLKHLANVQRPRERGQQGVKCVELAEVRRCQFRHRRHVFWVRRVSCAKGFRAPSPYQELVRRKAGSAPALRRTGRCGGWPSELPFEHRGLSAARGKRGLRRLEASLE
jgi:hypothetical protein